MDVEIIIPRALWRSLRNHLSLDTENASAGTDEQLAFLLAGKSIDSQRTKLLAREMIPARHEDLELQSGSAVVPKQDFVLRTLNRCQSEGWQLIEVHSHPFDTSQRTTFSGIDWENDRRKMPALATLSTQPFMHATMVLGKNSADAHYYDATMKEIGAVSRIVIIGMDDEGTGSVLEKLPTTSGIATRPNEGSIRPEHQRQEPILGVDGQKILQNTTVAVIGLGGLGSFVALELAHLGVGRITLIDPDVIEVSNLNRLLAAGASDEGKSKVEFYKDLIERAFPEVNVTPVAASIIEESALSLAKQADLLVSCVDNHGARLVLNHLATRFLLPLIDGGSGIRLSRNRGLAAMGGQVQVVVPGAGCLECRGFIDAQKAAFDLAPPDFQQYEREHGYGTNEPAPSVVFLNGVVASLQVGEVVSLLNPDGLKSLVPTSLYDALSRKLTPVQTRYDELCPTCGKEGVQGVGDLAPIRVPGSSN
jgi:molybdopterin/thiamine biosynthesis adenylyltransferase